MVKKTAAKTKQGPLLGVTKDPTLDPEALGMDALIRCVEREISYRERVYPRWVEQGKVDKTEADRELAAMRGVLLHLNDTGFPVERFKSAVEPFIRAAKIVAKIYDPLVMASIENSTCWACATYAANRVLSPYHWDELRQSALAIGASDAETPDAKRGDSAPAGNAPKAASPKADPKHTRAPKGKTLSAAKA